jgi:cell division protease FtsH
LTDEPKPARHEAREEMKRPRNALILGVLVLMTAMLVIASQNTAFEKPLTVNELDDALAGQQVDTITVYTNLWRADVKLRGDSPLVTQGGGARVRRVHFVPDGLEIARLEDRVGAIPKDRRPTIVKEEASTFLASLAMLFLPWLLIFGLFWFLVIRQMRVPGGPGGMLSFGKSRANLYSKERTGVSFKDVAGIEEAKEEVKEVIEFLKNPERFKRLGGRIPRGILLVGNPGCGKTLLAKAIAGEAGVPFFSICGSDFVEMFVGVGASRVRDLFKQAKEKSPCIIFLDEIDAVGRRRGSGLGGGHDEREQTLNAILVEMDGFETDEGVIVIAATNRPDVLDPALLRPGRFDRSISIDLPDVKGREEILKVHSRNVKLAADANLHKVARGTPMFTGAELEALINEAAILAAMRGRDLVSQDELEEARDKVKWGRKKVSRQMEEEDRKVTAYHEAGHAIAASLLPEVEPLHKVTIIPRGMALGATMQLPEKDQVHLQKKRALGTLVVLFGGRVGEELCVGDVSAGASSDIERASDLARRMVCEWGMSDELGPINYSQAEETLFLGREITRSRPHSEATALVIDREVKAIIDESLKRCQKLLSKNKEKLEAVAQALLKYETLSRADVEQIMRGEEPEAARAAQRAAAAAAEKPQPVVVRPELKPAGGFGEAAPAPAGA